MAPIKGAIASRIVLGCSFVTPQLCVIIAFVRQPRQNNIALSLRGAALCGSGYTDDYFWACIVLIRVHTSGRLHSVTMNQPRPNPALLVRIPGALCALPLAEVIETMRPLPIEPLADKSGFIRGVARIRGAAVPVVELTALFRGEPCCDLPTRFVTLRVGQHCIALAVQDVVGMVDLSDHVFNNLPPLLKTARTEFIETLGALDAEFLVMLNTALLVPDSVWQALARTKVML